MYDSWVDKVTKLVTAFKEIVTKNVSGSPHVYSFKSTYDFFCKLRTGELNTKFVWQVSMYIGLSPHISFV